MAPPNPHLQACVDSLQAQNMCKAAASQAVEVKPAYCHRAVLLAQVKLLLGFHVPRHSSCLQTARYLAAHIRETVPLELAMGLAWLAVLLTMKHLGKTRRWAPGDSTSSLIWAGAK